MIQLRNKPTVIVGLIEKPYDLLVDPGLTRREKEVLELMEYSYQEIADRLYISYRTVVNTSVNIKRKTGCRGKSHLAKYEVEKRLIN